MSTRSLKVHPQQKARVEAALKHRGFPSMQLLAEDVENNGCEGYVDSVSYSTVKKFFGGETVDRKYFLGLCAKLNLDWQEIAAIRTETESNYATDWQESPFVVGPPVSKPRQFFGREREIRRLFNLIKGVPLQNGAIIGPRRAGKTSLLYYLRMICTTPEAELRPGQRRDWLPNPERYCWVYVDFQDVRVQGRLGLMGHLLAGMGLAWPEGVEPSLGRFMDVVSAGLRGPTVVLLDEVGVVFERRDGALRCPELDDGFWESLRSLATTQTQGRLGFVLATPENPVELARNGGCSSPFFNIFGYSAYLGPLMEAEARALIEGLPVELGAADVAWMVENSGGWPVILQTFCREYLMSRADESQPEEWRAEAIKQIVQYQHLLRD